MSADDYVIQMRRNSRNAPLYASGLKIQMTTQALEKIVREAFEAGQRESRTAPLPKTPPTTVGDFFHRVFK